VPNWRVKTADDSLRTRCIMLVSCILVCVPEIIEQQTIWLHGFGVPLEKPPVAQLLKNFLFLWNPKVHICLQKRRYWPLSRAIIIQSISHNPISLTHILIFSDQSLLETVFYIYLLTALMYSASPSLWAWICIPIAVSSNRIHFSFINVQNCCSGNFLCYWLLQ
jgi:hypothetical protein